MDQTFMKQRPVLPLVVSMALPMTLSMLVTSLYNIVDSYFVAQISEDAMTALSLVYPVQNLVNAVTIGFAIGVNAVIAFFLGAGQHRTAGRAAAAALVGNILAGAWPGQADGPGGPAGPAGLPGGRAGGRPDRPGHAGGRRARRQGHPALYPQHFGPLSGPGYPYLGRLAGGPPRRR